MSIRCNGNAPKSQFAEHVKRERKKEEMKKRNWKKLKKVKQQLVKANTINSEDKIDEFDESNGVSKSELRKINWEEACNRRRVHMIWEEEEEEEEDKANEDNSSESSITMKEGWYCSEA